MFTVIVSRRAVLLGLPAAAAVLALPPMASARSTVNVRDYGATGDGTTDDSDAILAAVTALRPGAVLYFPGGRYRFAQPHPPGGGAVAITGISDVRIEFEGGAELVMDNVDSSTGIGTGHGIVIRGPASNISLQNVAIRWASPSTRSIGDGIRIVGYPTGVGTPNGWTGAETPLSGVTLSACTIRSCPQAGVIMMGVSDIDVTGLRVQESRGDGLHFNACRQARIDDYSATDTGDDGLALVTYYSADPAFDAAAETFSFPELTDWSNNDFAVTNVAVQGGRANGVRLAGANSVAVDGLSVADARSGAGVIVDSASAGAGTAWRYVASKGIQLTSIAVRDCEFGIHVLARPDEERDRRFTEFGVLVSQASIRNCTNWAVRAESVTDLRMTGLQVDTCNIEAVSTSGGRGGVGLGDVDGAKFGAVTIRHEDPVVVFETHNSAGISAVTLEIDITDPNDAVDPNPCVNLDESQGDFEAINVRWHAAPDFWHPVRITNQGVGCGSESGSPPVTIGVLDVDPVSVVNPVTRC